MHEYTAQVRWERKDAIFTDRRYSRAHLWRFDGGAEVLGSSSPLVVREPLSDPRGVDPEEAFIASLASCHMLFFLDFASRAGFTVDSYIDDAAGGMGKDEEGKEYVEWVELRPVVTFSGDKRPSAEELAELHHRSHDVCFIARSVKSKVTVKV
ncbi:MAG TPA: OsmC family protein [Magnetospirillaceae bacterium]|nr:OsmC family protein [Magnetospirillaceae bacterium]